MTVTPELLVWPLSAAEKRLEVTLTSNAAKPVSGRVEVPPPEGWPAIAPSPFSLAKAGERTFLDVVLQAPARLAPGRHAVRFVAKLDNGEALRISASDSSTTRTFRGLPFPSARRPGSRRPISASLRSAASATSAARRTGCPRRCRASGLPVEVLTERDLETATSPRYDAVVDRQPRLRDRSGRSPAPTAACSTTSAKAGC